MEGNTGCGGLVQSIHIDEPGALGGEATTHQATCTDATNGSADLTVMGGTAPYSFAWSDGSQTEDLAGVTAGTYDVMITDGNGCTFNMQNVNVNVGAGPVAQFSVSTNSLLPGEELLLFNTGTQYLTYTWDFGDGTTSDETEPTHGYTASGVHTITLTATDGTCTAQYAMDVDVAFSTGVGESLNSALSAWTEGAQFIVQWQVEGAKAITAEVLDATGRAVIDRSAKGSMGRISIPASELPTGVYFVRVKANDEERTFKLPLTR